MLIQIKAPHFVAGLDSCKISTWVLGWQDDKYYNECAPMKEWSPYRIKQYCEKKRWGYYPIK